MPCAAVGSPACCDPFTTPGGNPVTAVPGLTPRSPVTIVAPVLVTVEPARTAKLAADPRATDPWLHADRDVEVVKPHTKALCSALPARSLAPVVIVAVYVV